MRKIVLFAVVALLPASLAGQSDQIQLSANLKSTSEVPTNITPGTGTFTATITSGSTISFTLSYNNLSTPVLQSHIHVGASKTNGSIAIFLCGPTGSPAHATCPNDSTNSGTVTGTATAADVVINGQGIKPGEFGKVVQAITDSVAYVNVHTMQLPGGEIRGQVGVSQE